MEPTGKHIRLILDVLYQREELATVGKDVPLNVRSRFALQELDQESLMGAELVGLGIP